MRKVRILTLFLLLTLCLVSKQDASDMIESLRASASRIVAQTPTNMDKYVYNIESHGSFNSVGFDISRTMEILQTKLQLPPPAIKKFKNILFSEHFKWESFSEYVTGNQGLVIEFLGSARKIGNLVEIAYIQSTTSGEIIIIIFSCLIF